jgi:NAD(P)-dependent dehydrogenase (short-subunit alcohol dehydrogenase family)
MDLNLDGKVAVVTGAGKGIGLAVTTALAAEGARVVAGSLATDSLEGLKGVTPVAVDLSAQDGPFCRTAAERSSTSLPSTPSSSPTPPRSTTGRRRPRW